MSNSTVAVEQKLQTELQTPVALRPTRRSNAFLTQRLGTFDTLTAALDYAARGRTGLNFYSGRGKLETVLPYAELAECAKITGAKLRQAGVKRGERVAVVAETSADFMVAFFACQYVGLIPCPMPYSMYIGGREAYIERVAGMMRAADVSFVVTPTDLESHLREAAAMAGHATVMTHEQLQDVHIDEVVLEPFGADDAAYIQYSSGSTSDPKGVLITQKGIMANTSHIAQYGLRLSQKDRGFSWLPLYHDMGLVGFCLTPMVSQMTVDYLATTAFARRPALWLKLMSDNQCTVCYSPSFGFDLAARRIGDAAADLKLDQWRVAGIGGDMVRADVLELFNERMQDSGFDAKAFVPSYGMAETTLAITFSDLDAPIICDVVDRAQYKLSRRAVPAEQRHYGNSDRSRTFVACGRPMPDHAIEVRDEKDNVLGEREIGRVLISGPSLMAGYYQNDTATDEIMGQDGFMNTGDMGYWLDGQIVITGRAKDLILHNGRNIWPQDIEWTAEKIEPLRSGDVAAFAVDGQGDDDNVVVLVQCRLKNDEAIETLRKEIGAAVHRSAGIECQVVMVPPKSLPFTSSGKLSRAGAKARYVGGDISEIAVKNMADMKLAV